MSIPSEDDMVLLGALADGDLEPVVAEALRSRISEDAVLRAHYEMIVAGREAVASLPRPAISDDLLRRIEAQAGEPTPVTTPVRRSFDTFGWRNMAASALVAAILASGATYLLMPRATSTDDLIAASHRRSLLAASTVDVASSDRHTVKPYLDQKLGLSPPAPDLAAQGYPLVGGRVEVIGQSPVPALVYRHNEHLISLVAIPAAPGATAPHESGAAGYNMVRWTGDGFDFWAVSDLEPGELEAFASDYRAATAPVQPPK